MKYLITGASGFLGKRLRRQLRQKNHEVFCYDITLGYNILFKDQLETIIKDWQPNAIIHLAACSDLNIYRQKPEVSRKVNIEGTSNILKLCEKYDVRLLFASTCCCYGNNNVYPSNEESPLAPTEPYAISKRESEEEILKIGLPHCCMRLATFYGPEMRAALAPGVFLDKAHNNQTIKIHGDGKQTRTLTYVDDIVSGIILIAESEPKHTLLNVTTEEIVSVLDMVRIAKEVTGNHVNVEHVEDREGQIYKEVISSKRLQEMGWKPKVSFEEGMKLSYEYYKKNKNKWN